MAKSWFQRLKDNVVDTFDANTKEDQRKRLAQGQPQFYQQQKPQGNIVQSGFRGNFNTLKSATEPVRQLIKPTPLKTITDLGSRVYDQINVADNGLSFGRREIDQTKPKASTWQQTLTAGKNLPNVTVGVAKGIAEPFTRIPDRIRTGLPGGRDLQYNTTLLADSASKNYKITLDAYKQGRIGLDKLQESYILWQDAVNKMNRESNSVKANTSLKTGAADAANVALTLLTGGKAVGAGAGGKVAGQLSTPTLTKSLGPTSKTLFSNAPGYAGVARTALKQGAAGGAVSELYKDNPTLAGAVGGAITGAGTSLALGSGLYGGSKLVNKVAQTPLNEVGAIGKNVNELNPRVNITGNKNYNPDGLPPVANRFVKDYADHLKSVGSEQGVVKIKDTEGNYTRSSQNSPYYQELFKKLGRKPSSKDWYDLAYEKINSGNDDGLGVSSAFGGVLERSIRDMQNYQDPNALLPAGAKPRKNTPSKISPDEFDSIIRQREADQRQVNIVRNSEGTLDIQKTTVAPVSKKVTIESTTPTGAQPLIKTATGKDFVDSTNRYLGTIQAAETRARGIADTLPHKLTGQEGLDAIIARDNNAQTGNARIDAVNQRLQDVYDGLYAQYKDAGFDMGYVDQYSPRIYKNPKTGQAVTKDEYLFLTRTPGQTISRTAKNVNADALLYKTPQELLGHYVKTFEKAKAGREYFDALKSQGYILEAGTRPEGMLVIDAPGLPQPRPYTDPVTGIEYQGNFYSTPEVAKKLNKVFGVDEGNKVLNITAKAASTMQDIGLSGGVPGTPLNAFTFAQITKELTAGKLRTPLKALWESRSSNGAQKYFKDNTDVIMDMQKQGIGLNTEYTTRTLSGFAEQIKQADKKVGLVWDKVVSDPTFKRFMPTLQIETYKQIRNKYAPTLGDTGASELASSVVKNFYGLTDLTTQATRSKAANDLATTVMFAPKYRESMVRFWVNNAKAIDPRNMVKPEYAQNVRFNIGATLLFGAMQAANMALNGTATWDNPDGKKDKLIIPAEKLGGLTGGKDVGIPFLSSIATVPRAIATGAAGLLTGNAKEAGKSAKSFLGYGIRPLVDVVDNENYFGSQIYKKDDTPAEKLGAQASYLFKAYQHPYVREGLNIASNQLPEGVKKFVGAKDQTAFETASKSLESPLRFYDPEYYKGGADSFQADGGSKARVITIKKDGKNVNVADLPAYERFDKLTKYNKDGGRIKNAATSDEIDKQIKDLNTEAAKELNTWKEAGWPELKPNTRLTKEWASFSKSKAEGKISKLEENAKKLGLLKNAYIDQIAPGNTIREFMTLNTNEKVKAIDGGLVDKDTLDKAMALDNFFYNSGVTTQLEFSKKLRSALGYDTPGGKAGKKGKKISIFKPKAFSTADIIKSMSTSGSTKRTVKINPNNIIAKSKVAIKKKT